jgi:TrmH family RNA methyltransferase
MKELSSVHNPQIRQLRRLQEASGRREQGRFLCEGIRMCREAVQAGWAREILCTRDQAQQGLELGQQAGISPVLVSDAVMDSLCTARTPQGIACVCPLPELSRVPEGRLLVALDGVQDPGNLGTILRTADAAGFAGALLGAGTADPFGPKALSATKGSVFRLQMKRCSRLAPVLEDCACRGMAVVASELGGEDFYEGLPGGDTVLVIGSEGNGISPEVRDACTHHLQLPMPGGAESLNAAVAAGIMIYEIMRRGRKNHA